MEEMKIHVNNGKIRFVYSDNLIPLTKHGKNTTQRASHVEPTDKGWVADLSPVSGPVLGPFVERSKALVAEVNWLKNNNIPVPNER